MENELMENESDFVRARLKPIGNYRQPDWTNRLDR